MGCNVKKARVSWPSDSMLCQVKMFQTEDCPAGVGTQSCTKLPPGALYSTRPNISLITWKRPPQFILNEDLLVASGGESTETGSENLRIAKVLEAFYPHPSLVPTRPSISPAAVQVDDIYDDSNTPNIRLTPIEDDDDQPDSLALPPSHASNLAAASALLKTMEQEVSLVDADLLVKLLTDPIIINNLLNNNTPQHAMDRNSPPRLTLTHPGNDVSVLGVAQSIVSHLPSAPLVLNTCYPLPRAEDSLKPSSVDDVVVVVSEPQCQSLNTSTSGTWNMSRFQESARTGTDAPSSSSAYPMNITRDDYFKSLIREHGGVVTPATNGANNYKARVDSTYNNDKKKTALVVVKGQKPCMFFGRGRGCKLGESCLYLHDPSKRLSWTDVAPRAKRLKFGT